MRRDRSTFLLQTLEQRMFLSASPAPITATEPSSSALAGDIILQGAPSDVLTKAIRQELTNHLSGSIKATLQQRLDENKMGAFDSALLAYMRERSGNTFFWNTADVTGIKNFINSNLSTTNVIGHADSLIAHRFPNGNSDNYNVQLPAGDIDFSTTNSNPEFVHTLNRHEYWQDLTQAYVLTGQQKYIDEYISQLSTWSTQNPGLSNYAATNNSPAWQPLGVAVRTNTWTWQYQQVLGMSGWTGEANTLFLHKLWQQGERLRRVTPYALTSNRALFMAQGLMQIAHLVPEFTSSTDWKVYGRGLLFGAMDAQLNPDGGHAESSPGYAGNVILALLEMYYLDQKRGDVAAWTPQRIQKIENAAKAHIQLLSPDGKMAALSDTYRGVIGPFLDRARIILNNTTDFVAAKPRLRDAWLFGPTTAATMVNAPVNPGVPARGNTYSMPQSGYYVMRSGNDANARQVTFDAGPTGGTHGHYDLLSFELFGYGQPLISDPGLYTYDESTQRQWALSTPAHNTISVDNRSHNPIEGVANSGLWSSGLSEVAGGYQVTATHNGYSNLSGSPSVWRSLWFDGDGIMLVVDLAVASSSHTFTQSFLLPTTNTGSDLAGGRIHTNGGPGRVRINSLLQSGQVAHKQTKIGGSTSPNIFTSSDPDNNMAADATRFYVDQTGTSATFVTLVSAFTGADAPNITAQIVGNTANGTFSVQIYRNGVAAELVPFFEKPGVRFRPAAPVAGANDIAWDSAGRLHVVFNDREEKNLKYSVRGTNGKWSLVQTIDPGFEAGGWPSLALDSRGNPSVAYFDGNGGDLKYAKLVGGAWQVEKVDTTGSVGLYPSMVIISDTAIIGYYKRTGGDLKLATQKGETWKIITIDSAGDVGRCTSMVADPNKAGAIAIAYDDSNTGTKKFAAEGASGYTIQTVDSTTPAGGGYTSLAYEPARSTDGTFHPTISYYDSSNSALKFASYSGTAWSSTTIISQGVQGLYTSLLYDAANRPTIFFFKKTNTTAYRATRKAGEWSFSYLGTGGREIQTARKPDGSLAYTNLDADGLRVELLPS